MTNPTYYTAAETRGILEDDEVVAWARLAFPAAAKAIMIWSSRARQRTRMRAMRLATQRAAVLDVGTPTRMRSRVLHLIRVAEVDQHYMTLSYEIVRAKISVK